MARHSTGTRRSRRARRGLFESILEGAGEIAETVAKEVAPGVIEVIDLDGVIRQIDIQAVIERIDMNVLLDRIDVQALVERLDMDEIVAKLDINAVLEHVDLDAVIARTEIGSIIARSGAGVAGIVLDVGRSQGVGLDAFVHRWMDRLLRRDPSARPGIPPLLVPEPPPLPPAPSS
jgi:hypothetical protein